MRTVRLALLGLLVLASSASAQTNFFIQGIQQNPDGSVTIAWPAVPLWTYHVMSALSPTGTWQDLSNGQLTASLTTTNLAYTDATIAGVPQRFYKIRTAKRARVIMTLVLDRSGSMSPLAGPPPLGNGGGSGGGAYLPAAVTTFLNFFDESVDQAAMVSFASTATLDIPMEQPFKFDISTAVSNLNWCGGTFSQGGLTNALVQENNVFIPPTQNTVKIVVFFTDGLANMIQDTLSCPSPVVWNFGGFNSGMSVGFWNPATTTKSCADQNFACGNGSSPVGCSPSCTATQFYSDQYGVMETFTRANVTAEAEYRSIQTAQQLQANGIIVYSIGLGVNTDINMTFLAQVANATNSPTYNPSLPTGAAVLANDPSQLQPIFQQIASQILSLASP
ncbi:MAG TPA: vWA domain-containing protein [Verrucomicrobiae bacterium]|nr:vWA domain-containing protein [Verrucomicrobiae bacterium]